MGSSGWTGSVISAAACGLAGALLVVVCWALAVLLPALPTSPTAGSIIFLVFLLMIVLVVGLALGLLPAFVWSVCMWTFGEWVDQRRGSWIKLCGLGVGCSIPAAACFAILEPASMGGATLDLRLIGGVAALVGGGVAGIVVGHLARARRQL